MRRSRALFLLPLLLLASSLSPLLLRGASFEERELTSANLILPEMEQFRLGSRLFQEKDKKLAAWKSFQTFLFNYPDSKLAADAQFMLAESIFGQASADLLAGNAPDEIAWRKDKKSQRLGKGGKEFFHIIKTAASKISGEAPPIKEPELIDVATFSEAILQYKKVADKFRKSGLADSALFRIAECYYNMGDYPMALEHFKKLQKDYPQSYLVGESMLGAAQCYIPGGDFGTAELEIQRLTSTFPSYQELPQVQLILGIIRFQEGRYDEAVSHLEKVQSPEALFYSGLSLMRTGKGLTATAKFKNVVDDYPRSPLAEPAAYLMGDSFFRSKNYAGAIQEYKRFLALYSKSALKEGVLFKIGGSNFLNKDYPGSRESFSLIINNYPQGEFAPLARYFAAESYRLAGQLKEANFSYGQLITAFPSAPVTANGRFKLAWVTYLQKSFSNAADGFQRFIDWNPFHAWVPHAYLLMGNAYIQLGRSEEAAGAYQQAFDHAPKTELAEAAMTLLNRTRYQRGEYGQITSGYTYILKSLAPSESKWRAFSQLYLADSYYRQKLYREAISVNQSILALYPNHPAAVHARDGLSWCYFQLGDFEKAQKERESISEIALPEGVAAPTVPSGSFELANALFNQKKYAEAMEAYEKFRNESPDSKDIPEAVYRIGLCYYRQEYYTQAIAAWEELARLYPRHERTEEAAFQIADTYFRAQKYDKAIETYRRITSLYPKNANIVEASLRIGQSYYNSGDDANAVTELDAFLKKFPADARATESLDLLEAAFDRQEARAQGAEPARQKSIEILKGLVTALPKSALAAESQFRIARRAFNHKDPAAAAQEFEKVVLNYPDSPRTAEAQFYAAESYYALKKFAEAIASFQRFLRNFPASEFAPASWFHLGTSFFNTQKLEEAIEAYQSLLSQFPESEFTSFGYYNLALSQKKLQKLADAADTYTRLAVNFPQDPNALSAYLEAAKIKKDLKLYGEAILILKDLEPKIPAGDERKPEIASLIGECYLANNDVEEGVRALKGVIAMPLPDPYWKLASIQKLGELFEKQENWSEAVNLYEEAARLAKNPGVGKNFRERAKYLRDNYLAKGRPAKTTGAGQ